MNLKNKNLLDNSEVIEILGAFIGDGWIESSKKSIYITGSPTEDKLYYDNFLGPLFSKYFTKVTPKNYPYWKVYGIGAHKKETINKIIDLGFQVGSKSLIAEIPEEVLHSEDKKIIKAIIRGIFDTDGSFWCEKSRSKASIEWKKTHNYHPELRVTSCSKKLLDQIQFLLNKLNMNSKIVQKGKKGFKYNRNINNSYALNIRKKSDIIRWFQVIRTNNPRHKTRYEVWRKLGHLPPYTTIKDRIEILKNIK